MKNDVLVIGAGGAGLVAAISAHESGARVKVITKEYPTRSQTAMAQGGINAALGNVEKDSIDEHIKDTLKSAHKLADPEAVRTLCHNAKDAIEWLDSIGVCFSRTEDAKIAQRRLGGASAPRACYAQDYTGLKILHTLYDRALCLGIEILNEKFLLDFAKDEEGDVYGAVVLDIKTSKIQLYEAKSIIIATGGYSRIYDKHSTNSTASSGDGIAAALRAGAKISDMEFIQFHPTALKNSAILISESARGAGGYLLNSKYERFTNELAPRDEVARAIDEQIKKGEDVFLDIRHLGKQFIQDELPQERKLAKLYENVDPLNEIIPIKPAAHYTMGGIDVNTSSATSLKSLYAVGECANHKVHGANRLGGNSLLEVVVFGIEAGKNAASHAKNKTTTKQHISSIQEDAQKYIQNIKSFKNEINFYEIKDYIGELFYRDVGITRDEASLKRALSEIEEFIKKLPLMGISDKNELYNTNLIDFLEFKNMLELSKLVLLSAIERKESRGAHYRIDAPFEDEKFLKHTIVDINGVVE